MKDKPVSVSCGVHMQRWHANWSQKSKAEWEQQNKVEFSDVPSKWQTWFPPSTINPATK